MSQTGTSSEAATSGKSAFGLDPNIAGTLAYLLGPLSGIIFYVMADDEFTKFHALQCIIVDVVLMVTIIGNVLVLPVNLWLMYKAYSGEMWEFPVLGGFAK